MIIGIDGSRAFIKQRTGIEEYSYQVIKHLVNELNNHEVVLYLRKNQTIDFKLPENWKIKIIRWPYLWTQIGLSLEMLFHPVDVLFVPAHTLPIIHPQNSVVTIHGLEYEFCPGAYSFWARLYMRCSIKNSCRWAKAIIAVSENTKKDLMRLYKVPEEKIEVIYEGYDSNFQFPISNFQSISNDKFSKPYLLFVGRLEERKNIIGIIEAYKILVEKYNVPHALILAGAPGYGYNFIKLKIRNYLKIKNLKLKIIELGYIDEAQKWQLLSGAEIFLFPTLYEGFGIPILEAQSVGVPVVAGNNSSSKEIAENSSILVDPSNAEKIADAAYELISDKALRDDIIQKGYENVQRFNWEKCAEEIAKILKNDTK
jgi:glycosyltransferase involved in cell wall biosynthesis